jgi:membrane protease YdiL (CAAX protease family)
VGLALATIFPFIDYGSVQDRLGLSSEVFTVLLKVAITIALCGLVFGIQKHGLRFLNVRGISWRDLGAMLVVIVCTYALLHAVIPLIFRFSSPASDGTSQPAVPTFPMRIAALLAAGCCEEFIYRGFIIEELGELLKSRKGAGAISIVLFALAHYNTIAYGWSVWLLLPGLLGLMLTVLYFWRHNLLVCMLMHICWNVFPITIVYESRIGADPRAFAATGVTQRCRKLTRVKASGEPPTLRRFSEGPPSKPRQQRPLSGGVQGGPTVAIPAGFRGHHGGAGRAGDELRFDHAAVQHDLFDWTADVERASEFRSIRTRDHQ